MAAFIAGEQYDARDDDEDEQPTAPIPVPVPPFRELIRTLQRHKVHIDDISACVLCMMSYESQFGRPVDGDDYSSDHLGICQHHMWLWMSAHDAELDLWRAQVEMAYARYRPPRQHAAG